MYSTKKILGLIGRNVSYSYSPYIHNTATEMLQLPFYYTIFNIPSHNLVRPALEGAKALGIAGFNVTIPYKQTVVACMDKLSPEAEAVGAVNTIANDNGTFTGYNTDIAGVAAPLESHKPLIDGYPAGIFGNGGAAMAAIEALRTYFTPSVINLFVRNREKGHELCRQFQERNPLIPFSVCTMDDYSTLGSCRLVINATPIGTKGTVSGYNNCVIPPGTGALHRNQIIFDMVYNPLDTPLLLMAREAGATTIPGIEMLVSQASRSFDIWTGRTMPVSAVKTKLQELLGAGQLLS